MSEGKSATELGREITLQWLWAFSHTLARVLVQRRQMLGLPRIAFFPPRECEGGREGKNVESICNRIVLIDLLE